jgi:hypothetical protein
MMTQDRRRIPVTILICADGAEDRLRTRQMLEDAHIVNDLRFVEDDEQLLDYLQQRGAYAGELADIPMAILTMSQLHAGGTDLIESNRLGVSSLVAKPLTFSGLVDAMNVLGRYWLEIVESPPVH